MALHLEDCSFAGPALPEPFVKLELEALLAKKSLLPKATGKEGQALADSWDVLRKKLRALGEQGGDRRVASHVLEPLAQRLGYSAVAPADDVQTREGPEAGGWLLSNTDGARLRAWSVGLGTDLDAPSRRGHAYRFSPSRVAERVLLAQGERVGLLTDGDELRLLLCDPARPDSHVAIRLDRSGGWRAARAVPDSYRLLLALASPRGVAALPELVDAARLAQSGVTKKLRQQARAAIERFVQGVLDHPDNAAVRADFPDRQALAHTLWTEGLILVYRLLFVLKLESSPDPARAFSFAGTSLWRNTYSPNVALGGIARAVLDEGAETGGMLEGGIRALFRLFSAGIRSSELEVAPLGGMLFGGDAMPTLDRLTWGEQAVAHLLDALLWTPRGGKDQRERVHYGALDVEDLGRVYEALLELEPGIATEPMCRLRRAKLEVVLPASQGEPYRASAARADEDADDDEEDGDDGEDARPRRGKAGAKSGKTTVQWIEPIQEGQFFLRVGLGRKASGSYYTPHPFVRFLVQETLGPQIAERSPTTDPSPAAILALKVLDPAMGSGHFLVEACRYLGEALYEACRLCDERALEAERQSEGPKSEADRERLRERAAELRRRVEDLPDPNDELVAYLPSRVPEGEASGLSQKRALALCRRLVAVHCLYGVDKNPLAVALAKVSIWLESHAEGLPHTFVDHRLVCGDSLTGPFFEQVLTYPGSGEPLEGLFVQGLVERLRAALAEALAHVRALEATVGTDVSDLVGKQAAKDALDGALAPLRALAAVWSGSVMLGDEADDRAYEALVRAVADGKRLDEVLKSAGLTSAIALGRSGVAYDLAFPEVFHSNGPAERVGGFDAVVGNPPWDKPHAERREFFASFDLSVLDIRTSTELAPRIEGLLAESSDLAALWTAHSQAVERLRNTILALVRRCEASTDTSIGAAHVDTFMGFAVRAIDLARPGGCAGMVMSGGMAKNAACLPIRALWLRDNRPRAAIQFDNSRALFADLPRVVEFCLAACQKLPGPEAPWRVGVGSRTFDVLTGSGLLTAEHGIDQQRNKLLTLDRVADQSSRNPSGALWEWCTRHTSHLLQEVYPSRDQAVPLSRLGLAGVDVREMAVKRELLDSGVAPLLEGRGIRQFDGHPRVARSTRWRPEPLQVVPLTDTELLRRLGYFRLAIRRKCGSPKTNERSVVAALIPPGMAASDSLVVEKAPWARPNSSALVCAAVLNSFVVDALVRPSVQVMITQRLLDSVGAPALGTEAFAFLAHQALRLSWQSPEFDALWTEQFGSRRGASCDDGSTDARWLIQSTIDAVVAAAYGLGRAQYEHVLATFSHRSYPAAPERCLAAFDELADKGVGAFAEARDPYWGIPVVDKLPEPAINLRTKAQPAEKQGQLSLGFEDVPPHPVSPPAAEPAPTRTTPATRSATDRHASLIARIMERHAAAGQSATLGQVKVEKICHIVEAMTAIDLGREPQRETAGPADFPHLKKVISRAEKRRAFRTEKRRGVGWSFKPDRSFQTLLDEYQTSFAEQAAEADRIIDLFVPLDTAEAEIRATLFAIWNDRLASGSSPPADADLVEAFYEWSARKKVYARGRVVAAVGWLRDAHLVPAGGAKVTKSKSSEPDVRGDSHESLRTEEP